MKLPSTLSISGYQGVDNNWVFTVAIRDVVSGIIVADVEISAVQFALALSKLQERPCEAEYRLGHVGWKAENKIEHVPALPGFTHNTRKEHSMEALKPFEIDGWKARAGDFGNHHNGSDARGYHVVFFRHVPATKEDVDNARRANAERS